MDFTDAPLDAKASDPEAAAAPARGADHEARFIALLEAELADLTELAAIGMAAARELRPSAQAEAETQTEAEPAPEPAAEIPVQVQTPRDRAALRSQRNLDLNRVSRCVRLSFALRDAVIDELRRLYGGAEAGADPAKSPAPRVQVLIRTDESNWGPTPPPVRNRMISEAEAAENERLYPEIWEREPAERDIERFGGSVRAGAAQVREALGLPPDPPSPPPSPATPPPEPQTFRAGPRPAEPEPNWLPGEGPPPRPRRSRPYWLGPS